MRYWIDHMHVLLKYNTQNKLEAQLAIREAYLLWEKKRQL